jgi:hypothetical protein
MTAVILSASRMAANLWLVQWSPRFPVLATRALSVVACGVVAVVVVTSAALARPAAPSASGGFCPGLQDSRAEVIRLAARLGCSAAPRVALKTIESSAGFYKSPDWFCRWGQGGTRLVRIGSHVYYAGFCVSRSHNQEATFLGRRL